MAGIGGIEWGYCGECCKEVPIIKAAKGAMLEDHYQNGNSGRRTPCVGSLAEPGIAPPEAERLAFSAAPAPVERYDNSEPRTEGYGRGYSLTPELPCTCGADEGNPHLWGCAGLTRPPSQAQRVEACREEWARMLAGVTGPAQLAGAGLSRMRDAIRDAGEAVRRNTCATAGPHPLGTYPECGSHRRGNCGELPRGVSAELIIVDEINDASSTHYVDEEFTLSDEDARRVVEAIANAQGTNRESFGLHTASAEREPSTIGQIIARLAEGMPEPYLWNGPARIEINGVEVPGITSIEMEGPA